MRRVSFFYGKGAFAIVKTSRVLVLFYRLLQGERVQKRLFAKEFGINARSFDRDVLEIRTLLAEVHAPHELCYDNHANVYYLTDVENISLNGNIVLPLIFLVMGSRSFAKSEIAAILHPLFRLMPKNERPMAETIARAMGRGYLEPTHGKLLLKTMWDIGYCIQRRQKILLHYKKRDGALADTKIFPIRIAFVDRYFYLIAFQEPSRYKTPAFYRLDRIVSFDLIEEYGDYRKYAAYSWEEQQQALPLMLAGKKMTTVTLKCRRDTLETVQDRLPNHAILQKDETYCTLRARVYTEGFLRWLFSQGASVEVIAPEELRAEIRDRLSKLQKIYLPS